MGAETNALNRVPFPAPIFIFEPAARLSPPLARLRAEAPGDQDALEQIEEALDDQSQR